jgi:hypothetical protein
LHIGFILTPLRFHTGAYTDDVRASFCQSDSHRAPNAAPCSGDQCELPI